MEKVLKSIPPRRRDGDTSGRNSIDKGNVSDTFPRKGWLPLRGEFEGGESPPHER